MEIRYLKGDINSLSDLKKVFRAMCFELHPDKGGSNEDMQILNAEYLWAVNNFEMYIYDRNKEGKLYSRMQHFFSCKNISIEIIDDCIWVTGKTFEIKEDLKRFGYRYSPENKAWYWSERAFYPNSKIDITNLRKKFSTKKII